MAQLETCDVLTGHDPENNSLNEVEPVNRTISDPSYPERSLSSSPSVSSGGTGPGEQEIPDTGYTSTQMQRPRVSSRNDRNTSTYYPSEKENSQKTDSVLSRESLASSSSGMQESARASSCSNINESGEPVPVRKVPHSSSCVPLNARASCVLFPSFKFLKSIIYSY